MPADGTSQPSTQYYAGTPCEQDAGIAAARANDIMREELHYDWKTRDSAGENPDSMSPDEQNQAYWQMILRHREAARTTSKIR
ncbi:MAG: hypothetical protein SFW64_05480 [Alphaproteobacteria bacterium]|nr:hypothetical protein [Alphaproteobacteria bacterium]